MEKECELNATELQSISPSTSSELPRQHDTSCPLLNPTSDNQYVADSPPEKPHCPEKTLPTKSDIKEDLDPLVTLQQRLVSKNGRCNIGLSNVPSRKRRYLTDFFTTVIDMRWRYNVVFYTTSFIFTWVIFGLVWWLIAFLHRDDDEITTDGLGACVDNVHNFITAFLFSVETQQAIGYGDRVIQTTCPHAVVLFLFQSLVGLCIECIVTGLIFVKLSRPKLRAQTMVFSKRATICVRDGGYCLLFRIWDIRRSNFVQTTLRAILVKNTATAEGELIPLCQFPMELETVSRKTTDFVFLAWPVTVIHRITERSPLWEMTKDSLENTHLEMIVVLEGIVEVSSKNLQVRTSYLHSEILWGAHPTPLTTYRTSDMKHKIDFTEFHNTFPVPMPNGSARMYAEAAEQEELMRRQQIEQSSTIIEEDSSLTFEPLTFAPINPSKDCKRTRYRPGTAWKQWRKVKPLTTCCYSRQRAKD